MPSIMKHPGKRSLTKLWRREKSGSARGSRPAEPAMKVLSKRWNGCARRKIPAQGDRPGQYARTGGGNLRASGYKSFPSRVTVTVTTALSKIFQPRSCAVIKSALSAPNGAGKTTLLRLLLGNDAHQRQGEFGDESRGRLLRPVA